MSSTEGFQQPGFLTAPETGGPGRRPWVGLLMAAFPSRETGALVSSSQGPPW